MRDRSFGSIFFDYFNYIILTIFAITALVPLIYVLAGSISHPSIWYNSRFVLFPTEYSWEGYKYILSSATIPRSLVVTIVITVVGTIFNLAFTAMMAYALARRDLVARKLIMLMVLFTMFFGGGMIPTYLVVKGVGLLNSYWSLIIPQLIVAFNLIVVKNFFQNLPPGIEEQAQIDGSNDLGILFRIVVPLSTPVLATFALFYAVNHWNTFFQAILYINDHTKWPIQVWLRQIVILSQVQIADDGSMEGSSSPPAEIVKMAVITVSTIPILIVYPFLQKYFAKGLLLGSVKG